MTDNQIIQMHDYAGNNQYPVTLASLVYDEDGETVGKKLALLLDWFEWGDEKKTSVKTKYPFWSEKQLSAGGIGEESEGGEGGIGTITGIKVNGEVWNEPDEFGVLTIPDYPTSLEWADIVGKPTHLSQFTDDVVAGHYLSLAGGTIDSSNSIPLVVNTSSNVEVTVKLTQNAQLRAVIGYDIYSGAYIQNGINNRFLGIADNGTPYYYNGSYKDTLIHTGNVGEYAFVPRADDLINNVYADNYVTNGAYLNQTGNGSGNNNFPAEYSMFLVFSNGSPYRVAQLSLGGSKIHYRIKIDSWTNWREIACTDSNVASADYASNAGTLNGVSLSSGSNTPWGTIPMITEAGWMDVGKQFEFHYDNTTNIDYSTILICTGNHKNVVNLPSASGTLALLTDTVEAANRLATPRTIWGQSFDGTGDVSGHLILNNQSAIHSYTTSGKALELFNVSSNNNLSIGYSMAGVGGSYLYGNAIYLRYGSSRTNGLILNSSGNVLIGTTEEIGCKLDVRGSTHLDAYDGVSYVHIGPAAFGTKIQARNNGNTYFQSQRFDSITAYYDIVLQELGGNVGIGTTSPAYKLDVRGQVNAMSGYCCMVSGEEYTRFRILQENGITYMQSSANEGATANGSWYISGMFLQPAERVRINANSITLENGNVGIGTTTPETPLHVNGAALIGQIYIQNDNEINQYGGDLWLQYRTSLGARNVRMCYGGGGVTIGGVDVGDYAFHVAGNSRFQDSLTIGSAVLSWDSVNNALKIEGNVYTTGQLSAGDVGTEVQKVFDIAATSNAATANRPYTATLTHNLNTYDLAVVVYEVTRQSDGITEALTQVLADVTLTDENKVTVHFASRKTDKKYRIVIIG